MSTYIVTGRPQWSPLPPPLQGFLGPTDSVGSQIDRTLSAQDEATLIAQGIIVPIGWISSPATVSSPSKSRIPTVYLDAPSGDTTGAADQAMINSIVNGAGSNKTIVFQPGTHWVTGLFHQVSNQRWILSPETTIKLANASNTPTIWMKTGSGLILEGEGTVDGNSAGQSSSLSGVFIDSSSVAPRIKGGLSIINAFSQAISSLGLPSGTLIEDVFLTNSTGSGLFAQAALGVDCTDVTIRRVKVDKSSQPAATAIGYGVQVHGNQSGGAGFLRRVHLDDLEVLLPASPTNTMLCVELWGGSGGAVKNSRVSRASTSGGTMGVSLDHGQTSSVDWPTVYNAKSSGVEIAAGSDCMVSAPVIDGNGLTGSGIIFDQGGSSSVRCGVHGGSISGCTSRPVFAVGGSEIAVGGGITIKSDTATSAIYFQNTPHGTISGAILIAGSGGQSAIVLDGASSSGAVIGDCTVDGYTGTVVDCYSGTANDTIDDVHIGVMHVTNMAGKPLLRKDPFAAAGVTIGSKASAEAFPGFQANTTGLTSAQIDALFPCLPYDGQGIVDVTNAITLRRAGGKWYKTAALTQIA